MRIIPDLKQRLDHGLHAALEAEKVILSHYQNPDLRVETKRDKTVVTEADRTAELKIREILERYYPNDGVLGEEHQEKKGSSGFQWILDPIDGTQSFVCGVPLFGTMLGLTFEDEPVAGIVHMPALRETYYAAKGHGAWWKPQGQGAALPARVSSTSLLSDSMFLTTSHAGFDRIGRRALFDTLIGTSKKFRGWGSCYGHMLVATGRADFMVDPDVKIWDCAALAPILTEAGGHFLNLSGEARIDSGSAVSVNANLKHALCELLSP